MLFPQFDPVAFSIGPLVVRWYALAYILGFWAAGIMRGPRHECAALARTREGADA